MEENTQSDPAAPRRSGPPRKQLDIEEMTKLYLGEEGKEPLTQEAIGALYGVSSDTVRVRLAEAGVPRREPVGRQKLPISEMRRLYEEENRTLTEIGRIVGVTKQTVGSHLEAAGVVLRGRAPSAAVLAEVRRLYVDEKLTQAEVADRLGVAPATVKGYLTAAGVRSRPRGPKPGSKR